MGKKVSIPVRKDNAEALDKLQSGRAEGKDAPKAKPKRLTIDIPPALHRAIKRSCADRGVSMMDEIRDLLDGRYTAEAARGEG